MKTQSRIAAAAAVDAALALVAVVGLVVVEPPSPSPVTSVSADTPVPSSTTAPAQPAVAVTTAPTTKGAPTSPSTALGKTPAATPGGLQPTKDGSYRYKTHTETTGGPMGSSPQDREQTMTHKTVKRSGAVVEQQVTSDGGSVTYLWRPDGLYVRAGEQAAKGQGSQQCKPLEQKLLALPLAPGVSWTVAVECAFSMGGTSSTTSTETTSKVVGRKSVQVAGRPVDVWEIASTTKGTIVSGMGGREQTSDMTGEATTLVTADHGLSVREASTTRATSSLFSFTARSTRELQNLDPT